MKMHTSHTSHYTRLGSMIVLSFISMYVLMYAMVNILGNVYPNINQFYMAGLMTVPMVIIELLLMKVMYPKKKLNMAIAAGSILVLALCWAGIRQQFAVGDEQFLKSMIPHHASALLMCEKASITDPEIRQLCKNIIKGQQSEIDWMRSKLQALQK